MKKICALLIWLSFPAFSNAEFGDFYNVFNIKDSIVFQYRKNLISAIFPELLWDKKGFYLFIEKGDLRLFYFDNTNKVYVYQYPKQKYSPWLEPEHYLEERKAIESKDWKNKCYSENIVNDSSLINLINFHIEKYPFIVPQEDFFLEGKSSYGHALYLGFKIDDIGTHYFFFRDLRDGGKSNPPPVSFYSPAYHILEKNPFDFDMEACK